MKTAILFAALIAGCASAAQKPVKFRVVGHSTYVQSQYPGVIGSEPKLLIATDRAEFQELWSQYIGHDALPSVDFKRETALLLFMGWKMTGGFDIEAKSVAMDGKTLVVTAATRRPPARGIVTEALTSPWAAIAADKTNIKPKIANVRWVDGSGKTVVEASR
jgi:hypothetical protein